MGPDSTDFAPVDGMGAAASSSGIKVGPQSQVGKKRSWLMAFETVPAQFLNVYGPSVYIGSYGRLQ